ncbi:MAG: class I SAM-dependent methyltransferase, partial [Candidatus Izemoplasmatales bacterium]|nr:class I SAM-dependent methyltransferase [Candidatus Izemoplasmatales bacterium]
MQKLSDFLKKYPHARILDIGTGVGNFIDLISTVNDEYDEIVGIDILDRAIQAAMINFKDKPRIRFEKMDVLNMTFPEASFDIVCLSNSLHHLSNVDETFIAMKKVLKNGGAILINEMKSDNLNQSQMSHLLLHHFSAEIDRFLGITHYDTFSRNKILKIASES